jgi:hypothetical protein
MPKNNSRTMREYRKEEAGFRQMASDLRTPEERLILAAARPGESKREVARLTKQASK